MLPGLHSALIGAALPTLVGTFNPSDKNSNITLSNGNLTASNSVASLSGVRSTTTMTAAAYYEVVVSGSVANTFVGIGNSSANLAASFVGKDANSVGFSVSTAQVYTNGSATSVGIAASSGNTVGVKVASDGGVSFNVNGGSFVGPYYSSSVASPFYIHCATASPGTGIMTLNSTPTYAIPSGCRFWGN